MWNFSTLSFFSILNASLISYFLDDAFWYLTEEISSTGGNIGSKFAGHVTVPPSGWDYDTDGEWREDVTLTVTGGKKKIYYSHLNIFTLQGCRLCELQIYSE